MKKNLLSVCSAMLLMLLASCNGKKEAPKSENLFNIDLPPFEKLVVTTADETEVYKEASTDSPTLVQWVEDIESDMADVQSKWSDEPGLEGYNDYPDQLFTDAVVPVIAEEGDFYKISNYNDYIHYGETNVGYILKANVKDVTPEPLTTESPVLCEKGDWMNFYIVKDGKYKNLVLRAQMRELTGDKLNVGVLLENGCVAFPHNYSFCLGVNEAGTDINIQTYDYDDMNYELGFPPSMYYDNPDNYIRLFDPSQLSEAQIEKIFNTVNGTETGDIEYMYYFPKMEMKFQSVFEKK